MRTSLFHPPNPLPAPILRWRALLVLLAAVALQPGGPARGGTAPELVPGQELTRQLAGGESHRYPFSLAAGQLLRAVVAEEGVDVVVTLFNPQGQEVVHVDGPNRPQEDEDLAAIAEPAGLYELEVRNTAAAPGRYRIRVELRQAGDDDRARVEAVRLTQDAVALMSKKVEGVEDSLRQQIVKRESALVLWHRLGERGHEAATLYQLGTARSQLRDPERAAGDLQQAVDLWRSTGARSNLADALNQLASIEKRLDRQGKARQHFEEALPLLDGAGDKAQRLQVDVLNNLGSLLIDLGQPRAAVERLTAALALARTLHDTASEANLLVNLGSAHTDLSDRQEALDCYQKGLELARKTNDDFRQAAALNNLGELYDSLGDWDKALGYYQQARDLDRKRKDGAREARTLNNIGLAYQRLEDPRAARQAYEEAVRLAREKSDSRSAEAPALNNLGFLDISQGRPEAALVESRRALALAAGNSAVEAAALHAMGAAHRALHQLAEAEAELRHAREISRQHEDLSRAANVTLTLARLARDRGDLNTARTEIEDAIRDIESLRTRVVSPDLRAVFLASKEDYYALRIDILMALHAAHPDGGYAAAALAASEQARARSLLEILNISGADLRRGLPPALLERESRVSDAVSTAGRRRSRLLGEPQPDPAALETANRELNAAIEEYQQVEAVLRASSPRYAALTAPKPLALPEIQALLDDGTLLLEYSLGDERSYLWAVTQATVTSFALPPRKEIEEVARRFYNGLKAHLRDGKRADAEAAQAARELSHLALGPAAGLLAERRLLVVNDGALQYIPFAALPAPDAAGSPPLVVRHEIVSLPSASVLAVLRQQWAGRQEPPLTLAVLADPVFQSRDERVPKSHVPAVAGAPPALAQRVLPGEPRGGDRDCNSASFARLRYSRLEAEEIAKLVPAERRLVALDFDASLQKATGGDLARYRLVHFATHGCIDSQHPELSGLVLSLVDEKGQSRKGLLLLSDIYRLELHADLVVLSACQTALGKEIRGEGLIGLTRGFMHAGAARVLASLWSVEDRATSELMQRFYRGMLKEGQRPAAALRQAQLAMLGEKRSAQPYFWAGFTLQGDWQ
jgi:CHAT domain-containing protein/Tfp pilus assembly protein PilF